MRDCVQFQLNGEHRTVRGSEAFASFTDYVRQTCGLPGTKVVCAEGDCGACTVLVANGGPYRPIDSCIQFLYQLDGASVVTVEGLGANGLHPVQQTMIDCHGSQCGYCTPGFVMAMAGWLHADGKSDLRTALTGNLCRCTGYVPILAAAEQAKRMPLRELATPHAFDCNAVRISDGRRTFFAPTTLAEAIAFKEQHPDAVIVAGGTELGVLRNKRGYDPDVLLSLARIRELNGIERLGEQFIVGANATWTDVETTIVPAIPAFDPIVKRFGSPQIRNVGTLVGNVANGSPIADSLPLLMVLDAELEIAGPRGTRVRPLNGFYTGYKKKDLAPDELIARVRIPIPEATERLRLYKVSRRNDLDIATFGAAVKLKSQGETIVSAAVAYSGVAETVARLPNVEAALVGQPFRESTFRKAGEIARNELAPLTDVRGSKEYRSELAANILLKFYYEEA